MLHTIIYHGRYSLNFARLKDYKGPLQDFKRLHENEVERELAPPSPKVNGIVFGYMEKGKEIPPVPAKDRFFAVRVKDIVLDNPIKLEPNLHTDGKGFGPPPSQFEDESAKRLLNDIIVANPVQHAVLMEVYNEFF